MVQLLHAGTLPMFDDRSGWVSHLWIQKNTPWESVRVRTVPHPRSHVRRSWKNHYSWYMLDRSQHWMGEKETAAPRTHYRQHGVRDVPIQRGGYVSARLGWSICELYRGAMSVDALMLSIGIDLSYSGRIPGCRWNAQTGAVINELDALLSQQQQQHQQQQGSGVGTQHVRSIIRVVSFHTVHQNEARSIFLHLSVAFPRKLHL